MFGNALCLALTGDPLPATAVELINSEWIWELLSSVGSSQTQNTAKNKVVNEVHFAAFHYYYYDYYVDFVNTSATVAGSEMQFVASYYWYYRGYYVDMVNVNATVADNDAYLVAYYWYYFRYYVGMVKGVHVEYQPEYAFYHGYYGYTGGGYNYGQVQASSDIPADRTSSQVWNIFSTSFTAQFVWLLGALTTYSFAGPCRRWGRRLCRICWNLGRGGATNMWRDVLLIALAVLRCGLEIALILAKWCGPARRQLRRRLLALRARLLPVYLPDDLFMEAAAAAEYRPLRQIQGVQARWGGQRRLAMPRRNRCRVLHNPSAPGECLFAAFRFLAVSRGHSRMSTRVLRKQAHHALLMAHLTQSTLAEHTVDEWAARLGKTAHQLCSELVSKKPRWGNTLDLFVLAIAYDVPVVAFDVYTSEVLMSHKGTDCRAYVAFANHHFFVTSRKFRKFRSAKRPTTALPPKLTIDLGSVLCVGGMRGLRDNAAVPQRNEQCLLDSSVQRYNNRRQLAIMEERWHEEDPELNAPIRRPVPIDWLIHEDEWTRTWLIDDLVRLVRSLYRMLPWMRGWQQYNRTPPLPRHGGGCLLCLHALMEWWATWAMYYSFSATTWWADERYSFGSSLSCLLPEGMFQVISDAYWVWRYSSCSLMSSSPCGGCSYGSVGDLASMCHTAHSGVACILTDDKIAYRCGGAKGTMAQPATAERQRPYPFSAEFRHVLAHPPDKTARFIETTAYYIAATGDDFRKRVLDKAKTDGKLEDYDFLTAGSTYYEYYEACLKSYTAQKERRTVDLTTNVGNNADASSTARSSSDGIPLSTCASVSPKHAEKKDTHNQKPLPKHLASTTSPFSTQDAVQAVTRRRNAPGYDGPPTGQGGAPALLMGPPPLPRHARPKCTLAPRGSASASSKATNKAMTKSAAKPIATPPCAMNHSLRRDGIAAAACPVNTKARAPLKRKLAKPPPAARDPVAEFVPERAMPKPRIVLKERERPCQPAEPLAKVQPAVAQEWMPFVNPWFVGDKWAQGCLKLPKPSIPGLADFVRHTVVPIASLLCVKFTLISQRGLDDWVRAYYVNDDEQRLPIVAPTIQRFEELRTICHHVGAACPFLYIELSIAAPNLDYILNWWTPSGRVVQSALTAVLSGALWHARTMSRFACPVAGILLPEAHHLVVLCRPLTHHGFLEQQRELEARVVEYLQRNPVRAENREWQVSATLVLQEGGGQYQCSQPRGGLSLATMMSSWAAIKKVLIFLGVADMTVAVVDSFGTCVTSGCCRSGQWSLKLFAVLAVADITLAVVDSFSTCATSGCCCIGQWKNARLQCCRACLSTCDRGTTRDPTLFSLAQGGLHHICAFHSALKAHDPECPDPQTLVHKLEQVIRDSASSSVPQAPPLLTFVQRIDQDLGVWCNDEALRRDHTRGIFLDLLLLADMFGVGITVMDSEGVHRCHIPRTVMFCFQIDSLSLSLETVGATLDYDRILTGRDLIDPLAYDYIELQWCFATQSIVANVLFDHPPMLVKVPRTTTDPVPPAASLSSTMPWSSESSMSSGTIAVSLQAMQSGGGGNSEHSTGVLSEDERPLTSLLSPHHDEDEEEVGDSPDILPAVGDTDPMANLVSFHGKFVGGRTHYSQALWKGMTWKDAHYELNRDVRQKKTMWWIYYNGSPLDPQALVPTAGVRNMIIQGELRRLKEPLDFDDLRARGILVAPSAPSHSSVTGLPLASAHSSVSTSLVDPEYDSHVQQPFCCGPLVAEAYISSSASAGSSMGQECSADQESVSQEPVDSEPHATDDTISITAFSGSGDDDVIMVEGGAKQHRVQHISVAQAAADKLITDLQLTPFGLCIEHKCVVHTLLSDSKAARAVFQAQSSSQRAEAFAAALARAGLERYSNGMWSAAKHFKARDCGGTDEAPLATRVAQDAQSPVDPRGDTIASQVKSDPYMEVTQPKKRGRPPRQLGVVKMDASEVHNNLQDTHGLLPPPTQADFKELMNKMTSIEEWAHGIDKMLNVTAHQGTPWSSPAAYDIPEQWNDSSTSPTTPSVMQALERLTCEVQELQSEMCAMKLTISDAPRGANGVLQQQIDIAETQPCPPVIATVQNEVSKLWTLYHRLHHRLDDMGLIPEVTV
eukprot:2826344-Amphidinium_carterae.1